MLAHQNNIEKFHLLRLVNLFNCFQNTKLNKAFETIIKEKFCAYKSVDIFINALTFPYL
jgi:hypothetical protein